MKLKVRRLGNKGQIDGGPLTLPIAGMVLVIMGTRFMQSPELHSLGIAMTIIGTFLFVFFGIIVLYDYIVWRPKRRSKK